MNKNRLLLSVVVLIFLVFASFDIAQWIVDVRYKRSTDINDKISEAMELAKNNTELYNRLDEINTELAFINSVCLEDRS